MRPSILNLSQARLFRIDGLFGFDGIKRTPQFLCIKPNRAVAYE